VAARVWGIGIEKISDGTTSAHQLDSTGFLWCRPLVYDIVNGIKSVGLKPAGQGKLWVMCCSCVSLKLRSVSLPSPLSLFLLLSLLVSLSLMLPRVFKLCAKTVICCWGTGSSLSQIVCLRNRGPCPSLNVASSHIQSFGGTTDKQK
jgi:hypothetical protein